VRDPGTGHFPKARSGTPALARPTGVERDPGTGRCLPRGAERDPAQARPRGAERDPGTGRCLLPRATPATELQSVSRASQRGLQHHPLVGERASYFTFLLRVVSLNSEIPAGHQGSRARPRSTGTLYKPLGLGLSPAPAASSERGAGSRHARVPPSLL